MGDLTRNHGGGFSQLLEATRNTVKLGVRKMVPGNCILWFLVKHQSSNFGLFMFFFIGFHTKYDLYGLLWLIYNYDLVIHLLIVIFRDGLLGLPHLNPIMKRQEHLVSTTTD